MSVARNLPLVRERKQAILTGDPAGVAEQKKLNKLTARERIERLFDASTFVELDALSGRDGKTGVITGYGLVDGRPAYVYAQDYASMGGAVGADHARKVVKVMDLALKTGVPIVAMLDSKGARLTEGVDAVNAYALISEKTSMLSGVVPQIALVMGECAGTNALICAMNDIVIAADSAKLFVNGPQIVAANTGKDVKAETYGGAQASAESGIAHLTAKTDEEAVLVARKVLALLPDNNLEDAPVDMGSMEDAGRLLSAYDAIDSVEDVKALIASICDNSQMVELSEKFAPEMITAFGRIGGQSAGFIATNASVEEGSLTVYGCAKAARFVRLCDCFNIPVVTLVDTAGMAITCACGQGELARAGAQLSYAYAEATVARLAVVTGKAIGAGYMALASRMASDLVFAWPGSIIAPLAAPAAVQVMMSEDLAGSNDAQAKRAELEQNYQDNIADGLNAAKLGYVDDVIEPSETRGKLYSALEMLVSKRDARPAKKHGNLPL